MGSYIKDILRDHVKANQLSSLIRFSIALLISVLLVRSHFTDDQVGKLEYVLLIGYSFSFFWGFAYSSAILSKLGKWEEKDWRYGLEQAMLQLIFIGAGMSVIVLLILGVSNALGYEIIDVQYTYSVALFVFLLVVGIIPEMYYLLKRSAKKILLYSLIMNGLQLVLVVGVILLKWSLEYVFYVYIIMQGIRVIWIFLGLKLRLEWNYFSQRTWMLYSIPLVGHFLLGSSMDYIDGHLVSQFFEDKDFLYYRYGARELPFSMLFINALSAAMIPVLSKDIGMLSDLKVRMNRLMNMLYPISIVLLFISPFLFQWFYGANFIQSAFVFNVYLLIIMSRILMPQLILYAKQDTKALLRFSGIELIVNVVLSLILMQYFGMIGVAMATVVAFLVNRGLTIVYCKKKYQIGLDSYLDIGRYSLYSVLLMLGFVVSMWMFYE